MTDADLPGAMLHVDRCIEAYANRCRKRIPAFVDRHFSLEETWRIQRPTLWLDLLLAPVNSAWAIPYLVIKKAVGGLEALGVSSAAEFLVHLPSGITTGYQRKIEALIGLEILEWDFASDSPGVPPGLIEDLRKHPLLQRFSLFHDPDAGRPLRAIVQTFSSGRALVSDLAGTLLTVACGWLMLGNTSLGLGEIAGGLARRNAQDRAASRFLLGKRAGSAFYNVFPPGASQTETMTILIVLGAAITVGALACTMATDPLRKMGGLHQRRLLALLDNLERELLVFSQKRIKRVLAASLG